MIMRTSRKIVFSLNILLPSLLIRLIRRFYLSLDSKTLTKYLLLFIYDFLKQFFKKKVKSTEKKSLETSIIIRSIFNHNSYCNLGPWVVKKIHYIEDRM